MKQRGLFISFEGGEGCGKTTVIGYIVERLERSGHPVILRREPGGTDISEQIRQITHNVFNNVMDARTEALLMAASRAQVTAEEYLPSLHTGHILLADRYVDSSYAYQGYGRGLPLEELRRINQFATHALLPDRTFLFDLDPRIGRKRRLADGREDRIELEDMAFFDRVRLGYLELAAQAPDRFIVVDASQSLKLVAEKVYSSILGLLS